MNEMKEVRKLIESQLFKAGENKFINARISDEIEDKLYEELNNTIEDINEMIRQLERDIDNVLEENTGDFMPTRTEMMDAYDRAREDALVG